MYRVIKDNIAFHVDDDEQVKQYLQDGYEVYTMDKVTIDENGDIKIDEKSLKTVHKETDRAVRTESTIQERAK